MASEHRINSTDCRVIVVILTKNGLDSFGYLGLIIYRRNCQRSLVRHITTYRTGPMGKNGVPHGHDITSKNRRLFSADSDEVRKKTITLCRRNRPTQPKHGRSTVAREPRANVHWDLHRIVSTRRIRLRAAVYSHYGSME